MLIFEHLFHLWGILLEGLFYLVDGLSRDLLDLAVSAELVELVALEVESELLELLAFVVLGGLYLGLEFEHHFVNRADFLRQFAV